VLFRVLSLALILCHVALGASPVRAQGLKFDSAGVPIHYEVLGTGTPVLLIHGVAINGRGNWSMGDIIDRLAKTNQVIVMDVRGHGRSGKPHDTKDYGLEMVQDVVRLLDHLKIEKAHVVGYSMGGLITMKLATESPNRLLSACVCAAGWLRPDQEEAPEFIAAVAESLEAGKGLLPLLERLHPGDDPATKAQIFATNTFLKSANDPKALAAVFRSFPKLAIAKEQLVNCQLPVQFMVGTEDPAPTSLMQLKEVAPANFKIVEIKGADHMSTISTPQFYKSLSSFVQANTPNK
jgi:pimeloyl-ACP methyl ester carboxylesterase